MSVDAAAWTSRARRAAAALSSEGLSRGDKVAILLPNGPRFIEAVVAVAELGALAVPFPSYLSVSDAVSLCEREGFAAAILEGAHGHPLHRFTAKFTIDGRDAWEALVERAFPPLAEVASSPGSIFFTSGSTALPKTVKRRPLPPDLDVLRGKRFRRSWGMVDGMRALITGPLYHQAPLFYARGALACAETIVLLDEYSPHDILKAIEDHAITHLHMVPRLMKRIADLPAADRARFDISSLKFVLHGAAACPKAAKDALISWWGPIFREYYATSEFGMVSQIDTDEWLLRPSSVGLPFEGVEVEIRDLKSDEPLPPGRLGRVFMRSDDMPDFTYAPGDGEVLSRGTFLTVNDAGYLDEDGYLHLTGRADSVAVISGVNLSAERTRDALLELEYIDDALVSVVSDPERGDAFEAAVVLRAGAEDVGASRLIEDLKTSLPRLALPRAINFVAQLPVYDTGKMIMRYLDLGGARREVATSMPIVTRARPSDFIPHLPAGVRVIHKNLTQSTNADALELAQNAIDPFLLVYADQQSRGRGRQGRSWISPQGNLFWSLLVDCRDDPPASPGIVFVAALAARETVRALVPSDLAVEIKWPNDILIEGRKVAGILIETAVSPTLKRVVGIGINVVDFPAVGMIYPATSLRIEGSAADRDDALLLLTSNFLEYLRIWRDRGFKALKADYVRCAYRFGSTVSIRRGVSDYLTGVYADVDELGITIETDAGTRVHVNAGDLLAPPDSNSALSVESRRE